MKSVPVMAALVAGIAIGMLGTQILNAQPGIKRALLQKVDVAGVEGREVVLGTAEVPPGMAAGRHYHHGQEIGYLLEGTAVMEVQGKPPLTLKAGDSYQIEAGAPHDALNTGSTPAKVLAVYIVEKGKPLAVSVP